MIGSDAVANFGGYTKEMNKFNPLYDSLDRLDTGKTLILNLSHNNFYTLMMSLRQKRGGLGSVLPENYLYPEENFTTLKTLNYHPKPAFPK